MQRVNNNYKDADMERCQEKQGESSDLKLESIKTSTVATPITKDMAAGSSGKHMSQSQT